VKAVEESIEIAHRLQNEVGSYALMAGTGFDQKDFLTCCKFAEGDSRILMQKMSRDRLKVPHLSLSLSLSLCRRCPAIA
jgi:acyl-CoA oxidase